jgi:hypothetical protein
VIGSAIELSVKLQDQSKIESVWVHYKRMPEYHEWLALDRRRQSCCVRARLGGIVYYFAAVDEAGNAANDPNFLEQAPYFVMDSWPQLMSR